MGLALASSDIWPQSPCIVNAGSPFDVGVSEVGGIQLGARHFKFPIAQNRPEFVPKLGKLRLRQA